MTIWYRLDALSSTSTGWSGISVARSYVGLGAQVAVTNGGAVCLATSSGQGRVLSGLCQPVVPVLAPLVPHCLPVGSVSAISRIGAPISGVPRRTAGGTRGVAQTATRVNSQARKARRHGGVSDGLAGIGRLPSDVVCGRGALSRNGLVRGSLPPGSGASPGRL